LKLTGRAGTLPAPWHLFLNVFRRVQLPEEGCRDWQDEMEHCQPSSNPSNFLLNVFSQVQLPKEVCRDWPND
jgi:hypothetical protein